LLLLLNEPYLHSYFYVICVLQISGDDAADDDDVHDLEDKGDKWQTSVDQRLDCVQQRIVVRHLTGKELSNGCLVIAIKTLHKSTMHSIQLPNRRTHVVNELLNQLLGTEANIRTCKLSATLVAETTVANKTHNVWDGVTITSFYLR